MTNPHPLTEPVRRLGEQAVAVVAELGTEGFRDEAAGLVRAELGRLRSDAATIVVVGEKKRGKSSLINALVGDDLLPVDIDVATSVHLVVGYRSERCAFAYLDSSPGPQPIDPEQIAEYAALDPLTQRPHRDDVRHVEIGVPSELLAAGLTLVDTPGVGGLVSGHAQVTMATLEQADALVFVVNGSTELTASELTFLEQATGRIAEVLFVLTQTDKYASWQQLAERNRALLAQYAPRYADAPWFAVSSRAKRDADAAELAGNAGVAAKRLERSGFAALNAALFGVAARVGAIRLGNVVHVVKTTVDPLVESYRTRLRALTGDPGAAVELRDREGRLAALKRQDATWRKTLNTGVRELEDMLQLGFRRSVNDLRTIADERIASAGPEGLELLAAELETGVQGIWMQLENATKEGVARIAERLGSEFGAAGADQLAAELQLPDRVRQLPRAIESSGDDTGVLAGIERATPAYSAGALTFGVLSIFTGGLLLPAVAGVGVIVGLFNRRKRREEIARMRGDANRYVARVIGELQTEIPPSIHSGLARFAEQLAAGISTRLDQQRAEAEQDLAVARKAAATAAAELRQKQTAVRAELQRVETVSHRAAELGELLAQR